MILIISSFFIEFQFSSDMDYITVYDGTHYHTISNMAHGIAKHKIFGKGNRLLVSLYFNDTIQLFAKMEFKVCKYQLKHVMTRVLITNNEKNNLENIEMSYKNLINRNLLFI